MSALLLAASAAAQEPPTPAQNIASGASIYGVKGCSGCHAINGIGGTNAPDLAKIGVSSLNALVAAMWDHLPDMAVRFAAAKADPPHLDAWEAADLMAFLFWVAASTPTGNPRIGAELFTAKGCIACHQVGDIGGVLGPRLDNSVARFSSIELAAALWNHAPSMGTEMESRGLRRPTLTGAELDHLVAYLGASGEPEQPEAVHALSGRPEAGRALFSDRQCIRCHRIGGTGGTVGPDLTRAASREPVAFAAAMWNKGPRMMAAMRSSGVTVPTLSAADMADLVAYLGTLQYVAGTGSPTRGPDVARTAGCTACHGIAGQGRGAGGDLANMTAVTRQASVIAALWNHVRLPADSLRRTWKPLTPDQVADLVAYFERRGQTR